jgi:hypothetical protein
MSLELMMVVTGTEKNNTQVVEQRKITLSPGEATRANVDVLSVRAKGGKT